MGDVSHTDTGQAAPRSTQNNVLARGSVVASSHSPQFAQTGASSYGKQTESPDYASYAQMDMPPSVATRSLPPSGMQGPANMGQNPVQRLDMSSIQHALPMYESTQPSRGYAVQGSPFTPQDPIARSPSMYQYGMQQPHPSPGVRPQQRMGQYPQYPAFAVPYAPQMGYLAQSPTMVAPHAQMHPQLQRMDNMMSAQMAYQYPTADPRSFMSGHGLATDYSAASTASGFSPRASIETGPTPSYPRGPPRKPKQSGHALWVGNLPPGTTILDLKDHFSRDATKDIESLFLISKSNCAFVNYRSEAACAAAMTRFHDSRFNGVRLVCRLRRSSTVSTAQQSTPSTPVDHVKEGTVLTDGIAENSEPVVASGSQITVEALHSSEGGTHDRVVLDLKVPEKFFIVKSLTMQDLEASVRNGVWATQTHNEAALNNAFETADNVYLIFSANKSGEYFGYARMASPISDNPVKLPVSRSEDVKPAETSSDGPKSIPTPATETAPKGRIIDDSARGTIFWEAESSDSEPEEHVQETQQSSDLAVKPEFQSSSEHPTDGGRPFQIEWISTTRLPFYRTRGLRNPWNANREVKIARDGTELEPSVGRRLLQMFSRPATAGGMPSAGQGISSVPTY